ncbi:MAG TPA: hypothetical protein VI322_02735, partial [Candidatus Saccharimonadia bacterium]
MSTDTSTLPKFGMVELFPALGHFEVDKRLIQLLNFCHKQQLPYPVESKGAYAVWWHALHEVGHWAVKPRWYIDLAVSLFPSLTIYTDNVFIPAGSAPGVVHDLHLPAFQWYQAGNDVIPDLGMWEDPTPGEPETRLWCLLMLRKFCWPHPFDDNTGLVDVGDYLFHKPSSARVWAPFILEDETLWASFRRWGIDPASGRFRSLEAPNAGSFTLPYPRPHTHDELWSNYRAVYQLCGAEDRVKRGRLFFEWYHVTRWSEPR